MGSMLASCAGSCVAACGCQAMQCCCNSMSKTDSRLPYIGLTFLTTVTAGILRYYGKPFLINIPGLTHIGCQDEKCYGIGAVYMFMFALTLFFLTFALVNLAPTCAKKDGGSWCVKALYFIALLVASFFLPQGLFTGYAYIAQGVSSIFVVIQIVLLIDFSYSWNDSWLQPDRDWKKAVLFVSVSLYVAALIAVILLFNYYGKDDLSRGVISVTLVVTLLFTALSATDWCERGAILPSAACTIYCYWILYSALSVYPPIKTTYTTSNNPAVIVLGFIIAAASVCYAGWSMATSTATQHSVKEDLLANDSVEAVEDGKAGQMKYGANENLSVAHPSDETETETTNNPTANSRFHIVMASACCYGAMLLTDWGQSPDGQHGPGATTMWIQIVSQWVCMALYTWSLIAPQLLTNRDFS